MELEKAMEYPVQSKTKTFTIALMRYCPNYEPSTTMVVFKHIRMTTMDNIKRSHLNHGSISSLVTQKVIMNSVVTTTTTEKYACRIGYRDCTCSYEELGFANPQCQYITKQFVEDACANPLICLEDNSMQAISKYKTNNAFSSLPLADNEAGRYCHVPPEVLHEFGNGIYKHYFNIFHDIFGLKKCNKSGKEKIDLLNN
jgi:hypothetical protein